MNELIRMTPDELRRDLKSMHAECSRLRLAIEMGAEKNHAKHRSLRRSIARMTMALRQAERAAATSGSASPCPEPPVKVQRPRSISTTK